MAPISSSSSISSSRSQLPPFLFSPLNKSSKIFPASVSIPRTKIRNPNLSILQPTRSSSSSSNPSPSSIEESGSPPSSRIFIKGLSRSTSEGYLVKVFSRFGDISNVKIITTKSSKESLGLAYIWYVHEEEAFLAVKEMDGKFVDGRFIAITMAKPEAPSKQVRTAPYRFR